MSEVAYSKKGFLAPEESHRSMACYHAKIQDDVMKLTLHDCKGSIQLWNNLNNKVEVSEAMIKLSNLATAIIELQDYIYQNYSNVE